MAEEPVLVAEEWATRTDTVWYDDITYRDVPEKVTYEDNIYYKIRLSEPDPASKIQKIADFVKAHKNCNVQVTAYADKATGKRNPNKKGRLHSRPLPYEKNCSVTLPCNGSLPICISSSSLVPSSRPHP